MRVKHSFIDLSLRTLLSARIVILNAFLLAQLDCAVVGFSFRFLINFNIMSVQNVVPNLAMGQTTGLLGVFDGNKTNDMTDASGNIVCTPADCTSQKIYTDFGETCESFTNSDSRFVI